MGLLDIIHKIAGFLPEIKAPASPLGIKDRLIWTGIALILYFLMYETTAFGVQHTTTTGIDFLQTITASRTGSLLTTGIGPIVLASIFLQLFVGAGIINLNTRDKKDRAKFLETQKVLAIIIAIVEAIVFVAFTKMVPVQNTFLGPDVTMILVIAQIALGSVLVLFLDELVTKYGIGSGISLFIAAGVSLSVFVGLIHLIFNDSTGFIAMMSEGGAEALPNAILTLLPFIFTILVFIVVVYAESIKVEIPIAFERVRGMVPNLPLKFFYVSNIPVIFASALIINMQLIAGGLLTGAYWVTSTDGLVASTPAYDTLLETQKYDFARDGILPIIGYTSSTGKLADGLLYLFTPLYGTGQGTQYYSLLFTTSTPFFGIPEWVHAIVYIIMLATVSVLFGMFWVETSNMDAKSVANQLSQSGLQIPGFRRDPRMLETILNKHIFPLTVMGSFSVGLLAGIADLTGALGTGTGILLTVGILHKMYEQLEQMQAFEMYPSFSKMLGQ
jgi:preprotein translocase subunit SecY